MRALLVLGGEEIPFKKLAEKADVVICADSGADYAAHQSVLPDVLLGDMDSVSKETLVEFEEKGVTVYRYPIEKDKTDGEISLDYAKEIGVSDIEIVCAQGSIDHYLGNLYLLVYAQKLLIKASLNTHDMIVYSVESDIELKGEKGLRVSILPADGDIEVYSTTGLFYEILKPLKIAVGQTIGMGNYMTGQKCKIVISKGIAFVIAELKKQQS